MADVGSSKLACVNRILQQADMLPVSSLDTGGNSDAGRAELVLDNKSIEVQAQGLRENTYTDTLTADGSGNVSLPGTVLDVRGSHEHAHRNFRTDGDQLYDIDDGKRYQHRIAGKKRFHGTAACADEKSGSFESD